MLKMKNSIVGILAFALWGCGEELPKDTPPDSGDGSVVECQNTADCHEGPPPSYFLNPKNVECVTNHAGVMYCSECQNQSDCPEGYWCSKERYCYDLSSQIDMGSDTD